TKFDPMVSLSERWDNQIVHLPFAKTPLPLGKLLITPDPSEQITQSRSDKRSAIRQSFMATT
ncbi:MAG: hypothetical protein ABW158_09255, partial [Candidatus Thiodiazotropha sp. 6PDIVS]